MLKVFDTYSLQKIEFKPITPNKINLYLCGPTVYNYIHIGNARSAAAFDTIRRYLIYRGYDINFVSNFTDIDDKMINEAKARNITVKELADQYIAAFEEDTQRINILPATTRTKATDVIAEIIQFVEDLIDKEYAYQVEGNVFFRAKQFKDYGVLAHQDLNDLESGASGRLADQELALKEDPLDFAVWKASDDLQNSWSSPWGQGRPGWHIECSVMATKYLGNTLDIHAGGIDLAFPHHTNEIAQSEAHTGQKFVNYWLHNGFVNIDDQKMSKSLGNFTTLHDLLNNYDDPQAIRFFLSRTHYRRPINYSPDELDQAKQELDKIRTAYRNLEFASLEIDNQQRDTEIEDQIKTIQANFDQAMDDDFNTANALVEIHNLADISNQLAAVDDIASLTAEKVLTTLATFLEIFGISDLSKNIEVDGDIQKLLDQRLKARADKDYNLSDQIRDKLLSEYNIIVEDSTNGQRWFKK